MKVLLVVDMQRSFEASEAVIDENIAVIRAAKKLGLFIIVLEFKGNGPTISKIKKAIGKYRRCIYKKKDDDDGSREVATALNSRKSFPEKFYVTGVNRDACVRETVIGLSELYEKIPIIIIHRATNDDWYKHAGPKASNAAYDLRHFKAYKKRIIRIDRNKSPELAVV